jgi:Flp pilus assembly secretin CpaC
MSAVGAAASVPHAEAADLIVRYDQSQLIRLPRPVSEIIIGNPSIADVNVQGGNLLVVTGKTFGVTNIIALDAEKNVIQDQRVIVEQDERRTVVVYRGALRHSYTCAPTCSPATVVGDSKEYFEDTIKAAQAKAGASVPDKNTQQSE